MARRSSKQRSLFPVQSFVDRPYEKGSIFDILERFGDAVFSRKDFPEADPEVGGRPGYCPVLLSKLAVLQAKHGWDDRETVARCGFDLRIEACLGLGLEAKGPSQPTLSRHRGRMQQLGLDHSTPRRRRWDCPRTSSGA
jgi:hypothetical protein